MNNNYLTQNTNNIKIHINMRKFSYSTKKLFFDSEKVHILELLSGKGNENG